jgi:hypothetical protein
VKRGDSSVLGGLCAALGALLVTHALACTSDTSRRNVAAVVPSAIPSRESSAVGLAAAKSGRPAARLLDGRDFAVATAPSPEHRKGTIAVLSSGWSDGCFSGVTEVDLATLSEVGRVCLGRVYRSTIASGARGVVVASQLEGSLVVTWFDGAHAVRAQRTVPGFGPMEKVELYGVAAIAGSAVTVDGEAHVFVVDEGGRFVAKHACSGFAERFGGADVAAWGDRMAVLTNLVDHGNDVTRMHKPVCAFRVDGPATTLQANLPDPLSRVFVEGESLFYESSEGHARRLGPSLVPTGPEVPVHSAAEGGGGAETARTVCDGITGSAVVKSVNAQGTWIVQTTSCCGDEQPSGLFVCDPSAPSP